MSLFNLVAHAEQTEPHSVYGKLYKHTLAMLLSYCNAKGLISQNLFAKNHLKQA